MLPIGWIRRQSRRLGGSAKLTVWKCSYPPGVETKLVSLAEQRGTNAHSMARAAIERFVNFDAWFIREVEKDLGQIDRGQVLTHEGVGAHLEKELWP